MRRLKNRLIELGVIIGGNLILAFATAFFILPYNIVTGGVAGIAVGFGTTVSYSGSVDH